MVYTFKKPRCGKGLMHTSFPDSSFISFCQSKECITFDNTQPLMMWYCTCKETNILRRIFFDELQYWEAFKNKYGAKIRPFVQKKVEKFRDCGNF